jgi:hypothetical protein
MIRIAITPAAFEAIAATMPFGSVDFDREPDEKGRRLIWLERQAHGPARPGRELFRRYPAAGRDRGADQVSERGSRDPGEARNRA